MHLNPFGMSQRIVMQFILLQPTGHFLLAGIVCSMLDQLEPNKQPEPLPYAMSLQPEGVLPMMDGRKSIIKVKGLTTIGRSSGQLFPDILLTACSTP
jgi:hypothetical protein